MSAFSSLYESQEPPPLGDARDIVPPHRDGHQNGQQSGHILNRCFVCCCPGGQRGDMERVVTRWWCLVAFTKALDLLHHWLSKRPAMEVLSFVVAEFLALHNRS